MSRPRLVVYWVTTGLVAASMASGGVTHVLRVPASVEAFVYLGYPLHFVTLLGIWKILGALALLAPGFPRLKEWAYAGITFDLTGAAFAWAAVGTSDSVGNVGHIIVPLVGLALALTSWALRPDSRRLPG
ncbi:MAG TPA: DoxX family protein [Kofleriaceae bacterium]|nr:DoxX family protein [Kofleriaceae bacterium]